jgi:hypothetical protein
MDGDMQAAQRQGAAFETAAIHLAKLAGDGQPLDRSGGGFPERSRARFGYTGSLEWPPYG